MNDHKFAIIICTNDSLLLDECIHYIQHLIIPEGYELELFTIDRATCIPQAYNEAMAASDAKYKLYMHQDVFLLNQNMLSDLLDIFQSDNQIGLIGMVGYEQISPDGIMWHTKRAGNLYTQHPDYTYPPRKDYRYSIKLDGYTMVAEIDGFFMATCHDLSWDDEHLKGWDFYDAFQSMHFLLEGYKIAVPVQTHPWCMHDDNLVLDLSHYNHYRRVFIETYPQLLGKHWSQILKTTHPEENIHENTFL